MAVKYSASIRYHCLGADVSVPRTQERILEIFEGANEVLQWVIARQLIGRDVTG
ncbi:MAG: hypothetical protein JWR11_3478 [Mycobacterium sp.]|jgi:alkylation response protein AidB-like acyl-CoA dehydrogenase|nr:hypothetical protein [Mycobacterium sp.]MDT5178083.1 hypothetical protein [Mycobacterium sp.]